MNEHPDLEELRVLVALMESDSVSHAAARLQTSRARIRRKLESLEQRTGVVLARRTDGRLALTPEGTALVEGSRRILRDVALLIAHTREMADAPSGLIRLAIPPGFPYLPAHIGWNAMQRQFPDVRVEIRIAENPLELLPHDAEIAFTIDDTLEVVDCVITPILPVQCQLVASKGYLEKYGRPSTLPELREHRIAVWRSPSGPLTHLHVTDGTSWSIEPLTVSANERFLFYLASHDEFMVYAPVPPYPDMRFESEIVLEEKVGRTFFTHMVVPQALGEVPRVKAVANAVEKIAMARSK
ncbi:MAG: LysR family transcriptional regulator [Myxococcota bacterium]